MDLRDKIPGVFIIYPNLVYWYRAIIGPSMMMYDDCWNYFETVVYNLGDLMYLSRIDL
jgi:hypothetical protein